MVRHQLGEQYSWNTITCTESFKYKLENASFEKKRVGRTKATRYFLNGMGGQAGFDLMMAERERFEPSFEVDEDAGGYSV